jgi:hypothetical protein
MLRSPIRRTACAPGVRIDAARVGDPAAGGVSGRAPAPRAVVCVEPRLRGAHDLHPRGSRVGPPRGDLPVPVRRRAVPVSVGDRGVPAVWWTGPVVHGPTVLLRRTVRDGVGGLRVVVSVGDVPPHLVDVEPRDAFLGRRAVTATSTDGRTGSCVTPVVGRVQARGGSSSAGHRRVLRHGRRLSRQAPVRRGGPDRLHGHLPDPVRADGSVRRWVVQLVFGTADLHPWRYFPGGTAPGHERPHGRGPRQVGHDPMTQVFPPESALAPEAGRDDVAPWPTPPPRGLAP